jgi:hypothetical protein
MSDPLTRRGLPPVKKFGQPVADKAVMPPVPPRRAAQTLRQPAVATPREGARDRLLETIKWLFTNANVVDAQHAPRYPESADMRKFAETVISGEDKKEDAARVQYKLVQTEGGGKYRLYDGRGNTMSSEKWGIHVATLELKGERYFLYRDDPRRPWPA